jgi:UDP-glucuronate decarboxylase
VLNKRILVTGGAGFIGSHLCARLIAEGNRVICLDNFFTGRRETVAGLLTNKAFTLVEHDVVEPYDFEVDEIYNLACPASPVHYQLDPVKTAKVSVFGALHALELAVKYKAKVFQSSTSEVYGDPLEHPQREAYWGHVNPIGIRSCYDEGKRMAETLFFDYYRKYGVSIKVVRIFNTYGPNMHPEDGRVVSNFIMQALKGEPLTIYGDGNQTRSFCYVDDLVEGFVRMMQAPAEFIGPVNLGNPGEFTMRELAEKVLRITKSASRIEFRPLPQDDPKQRRPDISLAKERLDWAPVIQLDQGLEQTIEYFRNNWRQSMH